MSAKRATANTSPRPVIVAVVSDLHCGSTVALCPPEVRLDDGGHYAASGPQRWLWNCWADFWRRAEAQRAALDAELYVVVNGDVTDGDHHGTAQILSGNPTAQAAAVNAALSVPLALDPAAWFFVRGTEAHVGKSACYEERIADGLRRDKRPVQGDPDTGTASWWHLRLDVHGTRLDVAHHGRVGTRPWTKANVVNNLAAEIFMDHARRAEPHPHLAIRSHMHQHVDTGGAHPTRVIQTPAWQLATAFIHRIAPGAVADVGGLLITLRPGGARDVEHVAYTPERGTAWRPL